jgi:hypothetical protein
LELTLWAVFTLKLPQNCHKFFPLAYSLSVAGTLTLIDRGAPWQFTAYFNPLLYLPAALNAKNIQFLLWSSNPCRDKKENISELRCII